MKFLYVICFFLMCTVSNAQEYFSRIIPTTDNPLVEKVHKLEGRYIIPTDFFNNGVRGGLIIVSEDGDEKVKFENMDLGLSPILLNDDYIYLVGENPLNQGDSILFLSKLDKNTFEIEWFKEYSYPVIKTVNTTVKKLNDALFILNVNNAATDFIHQRELMLVKISLDGEELAKYKYNTDKRTTYGYELFNDSDSDLILSSTFSKKNEVIGTYSQVLKIDQDGEIIWEYEGTERLDNGAVPTWAIELSDSSILQTYYVDRRGEVDFIVNNWYPEPNKFIWLNADGELVKEKMILTDKADRIYYDGIKKGDKEYFYAYGFLESVAGFGLDYYCHLTKFSNNGDTVWTHNYQHPSYLEGNIVHNIKDIIEEENGDITILADIKPPAAKTEVWLFKVNSDGCYVNQECEDMTVTTSTALISEDHAVIYPNPTSGIVHIQMPIRIKEIKVLDVTGKIIMKKRLHSKSTTMDLAALENGIYFIQVLDDTDTMTAQKIIKL